MDRYIGIDAHMESCTLAVVGPTGRRIRSDRVDTDAVVLRRWLDGIQGRTHVCLEEGALSEWLYEVLEPHADELVVVQAPATRGNKSDALDAFARAQELRVGNVRPVFKAPGRYRPLREAVRAYSAIVADQVRVKNRLKALYRSRGLHGMGSEIYDPLLRRPWLKHLPSSIQPRAELLSDQLDRLVDVREMSEALVRKEARNVPIVRRIATAPGIAEIRASQIVATVVSPHRFRTARQFWSYCGLGIVMRSSSDWTRTPRGSWVFRDVAQTRGLNRNRHPLLKNVFKGAANSVVRMPSEPLRDEYEQTVSSGTKPNLAKLTLARKIAAIVLAMWKNEEDYDPSHRRANTA